MVDRSVVQHRSTRNRFHLQILLLRLPEMCLQLYLDPQYSALGMKMEVPAVSGVCNIYVGAGAIPPETDFISIC